MVLGEQLRFPPPSKGVDHCDVGAQSVDVWGASCVQWVRGPGGRASKVVVGGGGGVEEWWCGVVNVEEVVTGRRAGVGVDAWARDVVEGVGGATSNGGRASETGGRLGQ